MTASECITLCGDDEYHHKDCQVAKELRGTWCTPEWLAKLIGQVFLDPCSNPRSRIISKRRLMLERGDNGLLAKVGEYYAAEIDAVERTTPEQTIFINCPYGHGVVESWVRHYRHTRFIFLLRWDPSTDWFEELIPSCTHVWFPNCRLNFEPPPRIKASSNAYPHALYMRNPSTELKMRLAIAGFLVPVDL